MIELRTGSSRRILFNIYDVTGTLADPSTVTLKEGKDGTLTNTWTYGAGQITKSSTGVYYKDLTYSSSGVYSYEVITTGTPACAAYSADQNVSVNITDLPY